MDYLDYFNDNQRPPPRPERRLLKDRSNPLKDFDDLHFLDRFRMSKENVTETIGLLQPKLSGESIVCKIVRKVCSAICELKKDFIKFPNAAEQATYKVDFYEYGNFPGVIGCIDGCHIPIKFYSTADAEKFRNCKNWFSINVNECALPLCSYPILLHVGKVQLMTQGFSTTPLCTVSLRQDNTLEYILGDSGYAQTNFLFTPYLHPVRPEQQRYNQAHMLTRGLIERMFGVWKNRFQCLQNTLRFEPRRCCIVIIATALLHNFLKQCGCPDPDIEDDDHYVPIAELANDRNGLAYRDAFALQHF
ncbi:hypothetical protein E1301_Tti023401 [Triplophysa tibetana]|uniref:DDE Tnp4 domain-containing protein n=1 Tax=Triplophysa tibetana TaxID=1572043 RepID=A0A5A9PN31_9TELE|nr:hypothetical protein E1301_Tti023401 [Triplophysa tibetana]